MKNLFKLPEMEVVKFDNDDIVTKSQPGEEITPPIPGGGGEEFEGPVIDFGF